MLFIIFTSNRLRCTGIHLYQPVYDRCRGNQVTDILPQPDYSALYLQESAVADAVVVVFGRTHREQLLRIYVQCNATPIYHSRRSYLTVEQLHKMYKIIRKRGVARSLLLFSVQGFKLFHHEVRIRGNPGGFC